MPVFMRRVSSSAIKAIGFDRDTKTLYIQFKDKEAYPTYQFSPVGTHTAMRMFKASSIGSYYHRIIKPRSQYFVEVHDRQLEDIMTDRNGGSLLDIAKVAAKTALGATGAAEAAGPAVARVITRKLARDVIKRSRNVTRRGDDDG